MEPVIQRVLEWMRDKGWSQSELANRLGISAAHITNWKARGLPADRYVQVAAVFGKTVDQLLGMGSADANVSAGPDVRGSVPLLNKVNAGMYREIIDTPPEDVTFIPTAAPAKSYTFALRVEGDSMEPKFTDGMVIIVEPDLAPMPNDYVVAVNGDNEATFKQLIKDGGDWLLKPLNPRYPIKPLGHASVIGVVIGAHIIFARGS
jgi:SOS-response transcriptional repressor LexA